jgi:hypothetical protein
MASFQHPQTPASYSRVDITDARELSYWCERFHTTTDKLERAVRVAGVNTAAVEIYLNKPYRDYLYIGRQPPPPAR